MTIEQREQAFKEQVHRMIAFTYEMRVEFFEYWSEQNKSGTKMRFELEKTWDLSRRLKRWQMNNNKGDFSGKVEVKQQPQVDIPEVVALDRLLTKYRQHPTEIAFSFFGQFYPFMKAERLIKPMTRGEVNDLLSIYNGDNEKCRCACVQKTLDGYVNNNLTFSDIFRMRERLVK